MCLCRALFLLLCRALILSESWHSLSSFPSSSSKLFSSSFLCLLFLSFMFWFFFPSFSKARGKPGLKPRVLVLFLAVTQFACSVSPSFTVGICCLNWLQRLFTKESAFISQRQKLWLSPFDWQGSAPFHEFNIEHHRVDVYGHLAGFWN